MLCKECGGDLKGHEPSPKVKAVTCWLCVAKMISPPSEPFKKLTPDEKQARKEERRRLKTEKKTKKDFIRAAKTTKKIH